MTRPWPTKLLVQITTGPNGYEVGEVTGSYTKDDITFNTVKWARGVARNDGGYLPENLTPVHQAFLSVCAECDAWALDDFLCDDCRNLDTPGQD